MTPGERWWERGVVNKLMEGGKQEGDGRPGEMAHQGRWQLYYVFSRLVLLRVDQSLTQYVADIT